MLLLCFDCLWLIPLKDLFSCFFMMELINFLIMYCCFCDRDYGHGRGYGCGCGCGRVHGHDRGHVRGHVCDHVHPKYVYNHDNALSHDHDHDNHVHDQTMA